MGSGQSCPKVNTTIPENGAQWSLSNGKWGNVKLGWLIAGISTLMTTVLCMYATYRHARHYHKPKEQRQIIRILWMPLIFSIICFFAYRYYRYYIYYKLILIVYESFCLMAFLALMLAYVGSSTEEQMRIMQSKDKRPLPWPFGCLRYRPSKPYFLYALNGSVVQYALIRPFISIIGMICEAANVLCSHELSLHFANLYLEVIDFVSISIALYGLIVMYTLIKERLQGKRPKTKFVVVKLVVAVTYYQAFIFSAMVSNGVIKENAYWSKSNISDGLNAIVVCVEMVIVSCAMYWAYPATEYMDMTKTEGMPPTKPWVAFGQALNFWDFVMEAWRGLMYFKNWLHKRKGNDSDGDSGVEVYEYKERDTNLDINAAFNGARQSQSPRSSKFDMSEVGYRRSQALAYRGTEESSAPLSYPAMADDLKDKPDLEAARRRSAFSTESVVKEATAPFPMVPSTYRPGSMYRGSENRTSTIQEPETVPLSTSAVQPDKHNDMPVRAVEPVYGSLMAPRDLPALRRSLSKAASPANKHSTSTSDMHALAESVSEKKNESKSVGSVGTHWSRTALGGSQFTDNEALERGTVRPLTSSLMLEDMENGGVARQLQIQSRNPSPLLPRAEEGTTITRRASSHIDMPSAAEEDEGAPKQTDSAASERGPVTVFSLPETAQFSPIRL